MTVWPAQLPCPLLAGYQEGLANNTIRSEMDTGPAKVRRRTAANVRPLSFGMVLTKALLADLITFYNTTTFGGTLAFDLTDGRTAATLSCRFTAPPSFRPQGNGRYAASVSLEVLP